MQVEYHTYLGRVGLHRWQLIKLWASEGRAQRGFWPESDPVSFGEHSLALLNDVYGESQLQHARYAMVGECPLTPGASYFEYAGVPRPGWAVPEFGEGLLRIRVYTTPLNGDDCHGWWGEVVLVRGPWAHPCLHYTNAFQSFFVTSLHRDLTDAPTVASPPEVGAASRVLTPTQLGERVDNVNSVYSAFIAWRGYVRLACCAMCGLLAPNRKWCPCRRVAYCGPSCQRAHWRSHKPECAWKTSACNS